MAPVGLLSLPAGAARRLRPARVRLPLRWLVTIVLLALMLGGGWLWLRDSSLVRVKTVEVSGVSSNQGPEVSAALRRAARQMTTLNVSQPELRSSVDDFASVAAVHVSTDFPHTLRIEVTERRPVAEVDLGDETVPVGAGGRVLRGVEVKGGLPALRTTRLTPGGRLTDPKALAAVDVLATAPGILLSRVERVGSGPKGMTLELRDGPLLIFGDGNRPHAKWMAAARVLSEPSSAGALYLDLRLPERVAAGGLGTTATDQADPLAPSAEGQQLDPQVQAEETPTVNP